MDDSEAERLLAIRAFQTLPGVGRRIASDLWRLGIRSIEDLRKWDAESLYALNNALKGKRENRALLYIMRCAIYISQTPRQQQEPEKLIWWHWKDAD